MTIDLCKKRSWMFEEKSIFWESMQTIVVLVAFFAKTSLALIRTCKRIIG
jgi:hypothetical protein